MLARLDDGGLLGLVVAALRNGCRVKVEVDSSQFAEESFAEYALRFTFGGAITVCATLVARRYGPSIGGLFLAFPAILPASITLVKRHAGRRQAADDARGAIL